MNILLKMRNLLGAAGISLAVVGLSCVSAFAQDSVKVGVILPMSGKYAAFGEQMNAGFTYVVDRINAAGGIKGMGGAKLELVLADDTSEPSVAALAARKLVFEEEVSLLTGFPVTTLINAIVPISDQTGTPMFSFAGGRAGIGRHFYTQAFQFGDGYAGNFVKFLDYINKKQNLGITKVVIASSDSEPGKLIDAEVEERLIELGYTIAGIVPVPSNYPDLTPTLLKIRSLEPDAIISFLYMSDSIKLMNSRYTLGYNSPLLWIGGTSGYTDPGVWKQLGDTVAPATLGANVFGLAGYADSDTLVAAAELTAAAKEDGVTVPMGFNFILGAQAAEVIAEAFSVAGTTEAAKVEEAFKTLKIENGDPRLYLSKVEGLSFKDDGSMADQTGLIIQWNAGKQIVVWPEVFATQAPELTEK